MARPKLSVKEVHLGGKKFEVMRLGEGFVLPSRGVAFDSGLVVSCPFGHHTYAYGIGALINISETLDLDYVSSEVVDIKGEHLSTKSLYNSINESTDSEGIIHNEQGSILFALGRTMLWSKGIKQDWKDLQHLVENVTFINADREDTSPNKAIQDWAKGWLSANEKYIWAVRAMLYMMDKDWWSENTAKDARDMFRSMAGMKIPEKDYFLKINLDSGHAKRYVAPEAIASDDKRFTREIKEVISTYPTVRSIMGVEPHYGSLWDENFYENDLDEYIFKEEVPSVIKDRFRRTLESADNDDKIVIVDGDVRIVLSRDEITNVTHSSRSDEVIISFVTPTYIKLRRSYEAGDTVPNFVIDKDVDFDLLSATSA